MIRKIQAIAVLALASSTMVWAQQNPQIGTWKLNLAKSKFSPASTTPKSRTRTVEAQGDAVKVRFEGVAADGSRVDYSFTIQYNGKDYPIAGVGSANRSDTIAVKRVNANTTESISKKGGKVVQRSKTVVSKDGKVTTITSTGTNEKGQRTASTSVYEKQ